MVRWRLLMSNDVVPVTPEATIFGKTLVRLREAKKRADGKKTSQEELADAAGLTTNYLSDLERGVKQPSLNTILRLAHALDCAPSDLFADFGPRDLRRAARAKP